jgi:hypothetical protein
MVYATLVFNVGGILFYTTNQSDYDYFQDIVAGAFGFGIGAAAGALSQSLPRFLPAGAPVSEVEQIFQLEQIAIEGSEIELEADEFLDLAA